MADKLLTNIVSGSAFIAESASGMKRLASGASGDLFTITPASGKRVRLSFLSQSNVTGRELALSLTVGAKSMLSSVNIVGEGVTAALAEGDFCIGLNPNICAGIEGRAGEAFVLSKDAGSTSYDIFYAYEIGV